MSVLSFDRIEVGDSVVEATVRVVEAAAMRTSVASAEGAVALLPGLSRHRCENDAGARLVDELRDTETPHLLEHLAVELMALAGSPRTLKARTEWDFARDGQGVFRVRIEFDDDLVALGALKEALAIVDWLMDAGAGPAPDVDAAVARLQAARTV